MIPNERKLQASALKSKLERVKIELTEINEHLTAIKASAKIIQSDIYHLDNEISGIKTTVLTQLESINKKIVKYDLFNSKVKYLVGLFTKQGP